jgi:hypothetical protein
VLPMLSTHSFKNLLLSSQFITIDIHFTTLANVYFARLPVFIFRLHCTENYPLYEKRADNFVVVGNRQES